MAPEVKIFACLDLEQNISFLNWKLRNLTLPGKLSQGLKIYLPANKPGIIMAGPLYGEKIFWLRGCLEQLMTHGKRYDLIFFPVDDEFGDGDPMDFFQVIEVGGQQE